MAITKRDSNLYVDLLQEAVQAAFVGKEALMGTGVVVMNNQLPTQTPAGLPLEGGEKITIPYFDAIGELDDPPEGDALTPRKLTSSKEETTITRSGIAAEVSRWAALVAQAGNPHQELARQFVASAMRKIDSSLITLAKTAALLEDQTGNSLIEDHVINATEQWGDEMDEENGVALLICHSKVRKTMRLLKDSSGRRLYQEGEPGSPGRFVGVPVKVSDRLTSLGSDVYESYVCKRGAMAAWFSMNPMPEEDRDILSATDVTALWLYHAEHLYKRPGSGSMTKEGIIRLRTTET